MSKSSYKGLVSGSIWGIVAKVIDAAAKFLTIPLLVSFYGKADYGLIALAFSLNAYLRLMDMGMNVGSIRFFSIWIAEKKTDKIVDVSRSSIVFYGAIGLVNAVVFVVMGFYMTSYFSIAPDKVYIFQWIMFVLAASAVFNWTSNVITQLLTAHGEIAWLNQITIISSALNFLTAYIAVKLNLSLSVYFVLFTLSTLAIIPFNIYRLRVFELPISKLILPKWNGQAFKEILNYSLAIFAMGIFQFSADNLRPILLGKYATNGLEVLTDYRIIQTLSMLVVAFGGVFSQALLPSAAKLYAQDEGEKLKTLIYSGTKYISVFLSLVVFALVVSAATLLTMYMGEGYSKLALWLIVWLLTVLVSMHNSPVSSLVLSSGNTKPLVYMAAFSCCVTLPITAFLAPKYNVGAAVIGFAVYTLFQNLFFYLYYTPRVLKLDSAHIFFKSFLPPVCVGLISWGGVYFITKYIHFQGKLLNLIFAEAIFGCVFLALVVLFVFRTEEKERFISKVKEFAKKRRSHG